MKKLFYLFLLMFLFPLSVSADATSPRIVSYDAIVINPEGAEVEIAYCGGGFGICSGIGGTEVVKYDTKIKITQEMNGKGFFDFGDDKWAYIDLDDIRAYNTNIDLTEFKKEEEKKKLLAYGDVYLYNGPSEVYGRVNNEVKIPTGEIIEYEYHDDYWCYVTYNGVSGWIQMRVVNAKFASEEEKEKVKVVSLSNSKEKIILNNNIEYLYIGPYSDEKVNVNIPKNTILESEFVAIPNTYGAAPGPTRTLYVRYNDVSGWITYKHEFSNLYTDIVLNSNGAILYKEGNTNSEILFTIPYNVEVNVFLTNYDYVKGFQKIEYNGLIGYVKEEDFDETINDKPIEPEEDDKEEPNVPIKPENPNDTEKEENNSMDSSWHIKNVILTVFFCVILALVTLVTILLINKKKKVEEIEIIEIEEDKEK